MKNNGETLEMFSPEQVKFLKSELSLVKKISGIQKDVAWLRLIVFSLWLPVLLNLILSILRK